MRWFGRRESANVEDRRGMGGGMIALGGGGGIIALLVALFLGIDPGTFSGGPSAEVPADKNERKKWLATNRTTKITPEVRKSLEKWYKTCFRQRFVT